MNAKLILLAVAVAVIGAGALIMCDDSEAAAGDVLASGSCGTNLTYEVKSLSDDDSQVELVISGSGTTISSFYPASTNPWYSYRAEIVSVTLPDNITNLGRYAFYQCAALTSIDLPQGLTDMGTETFQGCTNLVLTELPGGVTRIGQNVFRDCTNLALTSLPAGLTYLGDTAFRSCKKISISEIPSGITTLNQQVFYQCELITRMTIPAGLTSIKEGALDCPNLREIVNYSALNLKAGDSLTLGGAGKNAYFVYTPTEEHPFTNFIQSDYQTASVVVVPESVTSIYKAFYNCGSLTSITLPSTLTIIGQSSFYMCGSLTSIEIPTSVTTIQISAFQGCSSLTSITMPAINLTNDIKLNSLVSLTYTTSKNWSSSNIAYAPQYTSRTTLQTITFSNDIIPAYALYGQDLDTLTITNASGADYLGIYTAPNVKATASALTVDGTAAQIVRLTDVRGAAELLDGGINLNDVDVHWDTSPHGYATGEVDAPPEVLVYPAGIHTSAPNQYAGLINAIPLIVIVAIITTIIGMMAVRRD